MVVEGIHDPAPQPENRNWDLDPGYEEDPGIFVELEDGIFYQTSYDGMDVPWYVSNVSIIFDCSMLLYNLFWMLMGFILYFYIIFGTNLLTQGPVQIVVFLPISVFNTEKEYQTESKCNETFGSVIFGTNVI